MANTPAKSSTIELTYPPLGWHYQHTHWQIKPLGHLSNAQVALEASSTTPSSAIQTKPLRQAAQLVGLPAELGDGSGFSNFVDSPDATRGFPEQLQQFTSALQPDIQPLWQEITDFSELSFQPAQPTDNAIESISEAIVSPALDNSTDRSTEVDATASETLPTVNRAEDRGVEYKQPDNKHPLAISPLQQQPLGQHQPLGFISPPTITDIAADRVPPIQPSPAGPLPESDIATGQQFQSPGDVDLDSEPKRISQRLNRTAPPVSESVVDTFPNHQPADPPTETTFPADTPPTDASPTDDFPIDTFPTDIAPRAIDSEPESPDVVDISATDISAPINAIQRTPTISDDINAPTAQLESQSHDISSPAATPEILQPLNTDETTPEKTPIETTDLNATVVQPAEEKAQLSPWPSSAEQSEPDGVSVTSTSDIDSPEISSPIQPTTGELPTVIQPALDSPAPTFFAESPEPDLTESPEPDANDGTEVLQARSEPINQAQPVIDPTEAPYAPSDNLELPLSDDTSADSLQRMPEIWTQPVVSDPSEIDSKIDNDSPTGLADI
ncbi:MAG: hypothetical protein KTR27_16540, partial [Leptolyngbyaceae cyanobacterium MAG.088]|nr:hypothetical protein [Leptolyngbyaceae cyanobacterium MAG.088]